MIELPAMRKRGFTLIELLVVVTIIVVLLALLIPAMDRAIYQADLAACGAKLKSVAGATVVYAMDSRRFYPDRGMGDRAPNSTVDYTAPYALAQPGSNWDFRPVLRTYLQINKHLQCPLTAQLDLEDTAIEEYPASSYTLWFGWRYYTQSAGPQEGMYKLGSRFSWAGTRFSLLAGDFDANFGGLTNGSHPDRDPSLMQLVTIQHQSVTGSGGSPDFPNQVNALGTLSFWSYNSPRRGLIDMNHAFDDLSVQRYNGVTNWVDLDKRMERVPIQFDQREAPHRFQIPPR